MTDIDTERAALLARLRAAHPDRKPVDIDGTLARWQARCAAEHARFEREYRERHADDVVEEDDPGDLPMIGKSKPRLPIPDNIERDKPMPLDLAARAAFPDGSMTVSGLRNEIRKGNLQASKVAGRIWTTINDIERMMQQCRITGAEDAAKRNSTCVNPSGPEARSGGSSSIPSMADASSAAQAHLNQIAQRLRKPSPPTSPKSTLPTSAKVVPLKS
jgi:hypothetical protein